MHIRGMLAGDLPRVSELSAQLGYPVSHALLEQRYARITSQSESGGLFIGLHGDLVGGWIHVYRVLLLESEPYAEVGGLVVDKLARRLGIGRALVGGARDWAQKQGLARLRVRSNVARVEAHAFYPALGFSRIKTTHTYELKLA